jgi:type VI secretion system protein ImpK
MSENDPFFPSRKDDDRTIIRPAPGGRRPEPRESIPPGGSPRGGPPPMASGPAVATGPELGELDAGPGMNRLETAAFRLINVAVGFRHATAQPDLGQVRDRMTRLLKDFRTEVERAGYSGEVVRQAHYALCAFVDEIVLATPWGSQSRWQEHSLLSAFHRQTWGGEEFFNIIEKNEVDAARNIDLLALLYVLLVLGFEGAHATRPNGRELLEKTQDRLYQTIRNQRSEVERDLSPNWQGTDAGKPGLTGLIPLWAFAAIGAGILLLGFLGFSISLNRASDPLLGQVASLDAEVLNRLEPAARMPTVETESALVTLRQLLSDDIAAERVMLESDARSAIVRVKGDGLFASGSDRIESEYEPVVQRIADAIGRVPGRVLITGHSDNVPIFSARFPSNWHLSEARARSVLQLLTASGADESRFSHEGRADTEPLADNASAEGRARNRRVDIAVFSVGAGGPES